MSPIITPAGGGGGGGATPGAGIVRGPFSFTHATAGISSGGVTVFTPAIGDVLLDVLVIITTPFDGTTPQYDVGLIETNGVGIFGNFYNWLDATQQGVQFTDYLQGGAPAIGTTPAFTNPASALAFGSAAVAGVTNGVPPVTPSVFLDSAPFKLWVTQNGKSSGADPVCTVGAGALYVTTATPTPFT